VGVGRVRGNLGGGGGNFGLAREEAMTGSGWRAVGDFVFFIREG
jgi:hypothetical protein